MTRLGIATTAILLTVTAWLQACALPNGCILVVPAGHEVPGDWIYDGPTDSWWDPQTGFVGFSLEEDGTIWAPTYRCATSNGAQY